MSKIKIQLMPGGKSCYLDWHITRTEKYYRSTYIQIKGPEKLSHAFMTKSIITSWNTSKDVKFIYANSTMISYLESEDEEIRHLGVDMVLQMFKDKYNEDNIKI